MDGQKALITGASSGIGAALARRMAARGVEVWLAARRADKLADVVRDIEAKGGRAHAVELDVSDPPTTTRRVVELDDQIGGIDVVVANAGVGGGGKPVSRMTYDDAARVFQTNLLGALATILPLVPRLLERAKGGRRGQIVAVSSLSAEIALPVAPDYGASKAALSFFLEGAQGELPSKGVDVTIVHPGYVKTDLTANNKFPMQFLLELDEAAEVIDRAIERRVLKVRFPLGLVGMITVGKWAPVSLRGRVVRRSAG